MRLDKANKMEFIKQRIFVASILLGLCVIATSCDDNGAPEDSILQPLEEHLQGVWQEWKSYEVKDGKYIETPNPENYMIEFDLRPNGKMVVSYDYTISSIWPSTWSVNEKDNMVTVENTTYRIYRLSDSEMEVGSNTSNNVETGETMHGDFRWIWKRLDNFHDTYATRLLGKWKLLRRYEIKDKQWVEIPISADDEGWREYRETGACTYYERIGGNELRIDYDYWGAMDYVNWDGVFQAYHGIDGEPYNDYVAFTVNPDGTLTAYSLDFFDAGGEGVADVGRKDILVLIN